MPPLAIQDPDLTGLRVLVLGAGSSGLAAARLAAARGARVTVADRRPAADLQAQAASLGGVRAFLHAGGHPETLAEACDLVVASPGVPADVAVLQAARRRGIPVWGEIELASRFCRGRIVGVTGSNGKSTVTSMIGHTLRLAGIPGGTGGNLGPPFAELLDRDAADAIHAVELSSFQLETVETLAVSVALITNLSPDHLDRHADYDDYARAKSRLLELQRPEAYALLNADDGESRRFRSAVRSRLLLFATRGEMEAGAFVRDGRLRLRTEHGDETLLPAAELPLPGEHNLSNALAAALALRLAGCAPRAIDEGLRSFRALPHRLEHVGRIGGVDFYNDSKATNPASTLRALLAFEPAKVRLILGGQDKGAAWDELLGTAARHARQVLLVGQAADDLARRLPRGLDAPSCGTVPAAVERALADAAPGDVVLLSPGCASFDQYVNYEARGEEFCRIVRRLAAAEGRDA